MSLTDSCPACLRRGIQPTATRIRRRAVVHGYRCPSCGHTWATARLSTAYRTDRSAA